MKLEHGAGRWVFDQDRLAYYLMMAVIETTDREQRGQLLAMMTEEQRAMARRAKDGSWKRY